MEILIKTQIKITNHHLDLGFRFDSSPEIKYKKYSQLYCSIFWCSITHKYIILLYIVVFAWCLAPGGVIRYSAFVHLNGSLCRMHPILSDSSPDWKIKNHSFHSWFPFDLRSFGIAYARPSGFHWSLKPFQTSDKITSGQIFAIAQS